MSGPRTFDATPVDQAVVDGSLVRAKQGRTVSVCIPARNEQGTVGAVVRTVVQAWTEGGGGSGLVDEVLVIDDGSQDQTARRAREAGAEVVTRSGPHGKGRAMRAGVEHTHGDLVAFLDADVVELSPHFVSRLVGPLLLHEDLCLVKGTYRRPLHDAPSGGGRVTELVARPLLDLLFPELADVRQPLAGETAAPRRVLDKMSFEPGYGVELGLLVDVAQAFGPAAIGQVDLGVRLHRNRTLEELRPQATDILRAALQRRGALPRSADA